MKRTDPLPTITPLAPPKKMHQHLARALPGWMISLEVYLYGREYRHRAHARTTIHRKGTTTTVDVAGDLCDGERAAWVALVHALSAYEHLDINERAQVHALLDVLPAGGAR